MKFILFLALVLCPSIVPTASSLQLGLKAAPLIGGPSWLPLHVKIVVEGDHTWDFVPLNATSPNTLKQLVSLKSVPGEIRYRQGKRGVDEQKDMYATPMVHRAQKFVDSYSNRDLNLISNNCWTFALMMYWHLRSTEMTNEQDDASSS